MSETHSDLRTTTSVTGRENILATSLVHPLSMQFRPHPPTIRSAAAIALVFYASFFLLVTVSDGSRQFSATGDNSFGRRGRPGIARKELVTINGASLELQRGRGRNLLGRSEGASVQLRLMHRNSPRSPFRKLHGSGLEALTEARDMDFDRRQGFEKRLQSSRHASLLAATGGGAAAGQPAAGKQGSGDFRASVRSGAAAGTGQYFVDFYVGTPAQKFLMIADTGSDLIWIRCSNCKKCGTQTAAGGVFDAASSTTYSPVPCVSQQCLLVPPASTAQPSCNSRTPSGCAYEYQYADLSNTSGIFSLETFTFNSSSRGTLRVPNVAFGCGLTNLGRSFAGAGGVLGLGRGQISFPSQIGSMVGNKFSYCFVDYLRNPAEDSYLVFGNAPATSKLQAPLKYTPFQKNPFGESFYYVGIQEVRVDDTLLAIPSTVWQIDEAGNQGTVIDSGTTLTYFMEPAYRTILQAMTKALTYPRVAPLQTFDLCFNASGLSNLTLPKFSITFQGNAIFEPPPTNYFINVLNGVRCLGLQGVESAFGYSVLGNLLQQNFNMEYDRNSWRLGFAPTVCSAAS